MNLLKRIYPFVKPYRATFMRALLAMALFSALQAVMLYLIKYATDDIVARLNPANLPKLCTAILFIALAKGICNYYEAYDMQAIGYKVIRDIRNALFEHLMEMSMDFYHKASTGRLMSRITHDAAVLQHAVTYGPRNILRDGLMVAFLLGVLFKLNYQWTIVTVIAFPLVALVIRRFTGRLRDLSRQSQQKTSEIFGFLQEKFSGVLLIKASNTEYEEGLALRREHQQLLDMTLKAEKARAMQRPIVEMITVVALVTIMVLGGIDVAAGRATVGTFIAFIAGCMMIYQPARSMTEINDQLQSAVAAAERLFELFDERPSCVEMPGAKTMPPLRHEIVFDRVCFSYGGAQQVLRDVSLTIHKGERVALVGPSGAGKTTMAGMILRLFDPAGGRITIDGQDLREFSFKSLRGQMGVVSQDVILFNDTVHRNIAYGLPHAQEQAAQAAAKTAHADEFIQKLPRGYQTIIGERGVTLSGGQRQRLAIARAVLRDPRILILDEATSDLDSESEAFIQSALEALMKNRTTLTIAHRLSTVKASDRIVVIERGRIIAEGTHEHLMTHCALYRKLYEIQFAA